MVVWQTGYYNISIKTKPKQDRVMDRFISSCCLSSPECLNNTILHFVNSVVSKSDIKKKEKCITSFDFRIIPDNVI